MRDNKIKIMNVEKNIKAILFPTDFSDLSENAMLTAIAVCKRHSATLHLLHVLDLPFHSAVSLAHPLHQTVQSSEAAVTEALTTLAAFVQTQHGISPEIHLVSGSPVQLIAEKAESLDCGLIIMGTHGASGFREFFMGTTAYAVIKNSIVPVLTVPGGKVRHEFRKIIFPVRATSGILEKYDFSFPIIRENDSKVVIVCLSKPGESFEHNYLEEKLRQLTWKMQESAVPFTIQLRKCDHYAQEVLKVAKNENADLIIINATLDYKWSRFFIGPYTQQVVNHAAIPVLSIRETGNDADVEGVKEWNADRKERLAF
jgi:nucleotide-binding universal stress UspA family protein